MPEEKIDFQLSDDDVADVKEYTDDDINSDDFDPTATLKEQTGIAKRRTTQLKKAKEAIDAQKAYIEELKGQKPDKPTGEAPEGQTKKGLDFSQKTYLLQKGIDEEYFGKVEEAMESLGGNDEDTLTRVINNPYFKAELETLKAEKTARDGTPEGGEGGSQGGENTVDYWMKKGGLPEADMSDPARIKLRADISRERARLSRKNLSN